MKEGKQASYKIVLPALPVFHIFYDVEGVPPVPKSVQPVSSTSTDYAGKISIFSF